MFGWFKKQHKRKAAEQLASAAKSPQDKRVEELLAQGYEHIGSFDQKSDGSLGKFTPSPAEAKRRAEGQGK